MITVTKTGLFLVRGYDNEYSAKADISDFKSAIGKQGSTIFRDKSAMFPLPANYGVECSILDAEGPVPYITIKGGVREFAVMLSIAVTAKDSRETVAMDGVEHWIRDATVKISSIMVQ